MRDISQDAGVLAYRGFSEYDNPKHSEQRGVLKEEWSRKSGWKERAAKSGQEGWEELGGYRLRSKLHNIYLYISCL